MEVKVERAPLAPRIDDVRADICMPDMGAFTEAAAFRLEFDKTADDLMLN